MADWRRASSVVPPSTGSSAKGRGALELHRWRTGHRWLPKLITPAKLSRGWSPTTTQRARPK